MHLFVMAKEEEFLTVPGRGLQKEKEDGTKQQHENFRGFIVETQACHVVLVCAKGMHAG